jgi:signal transduction histidine kinase
LGADLSYQRRYDSAYLYHFWYTRLKDSIFNEETAQKIAIIQAQYEEEKKEAKITLLEKEKEIAKDEKQRYIVGFTGFALTLLLILFFIIKNNRQKQKVNHLLKEKNEEIATQNEELLQAKEEITVQRDMLEEQNKRLKEANDAKNKLFSIVSHDLRSPINRLKGILSLVVHDAISEAELKMYFANLYGNINSLHDTLDNLLQWAYSQMEGIKSNPQKVNISYLIENHITLFSEITKAKQIKITQKVPPDLYAFADENQVRLILRNLIHNAIKFTPLQGQIIILAKQIEGFVEIAVKDTGVGMSKEQIANLFQIYLHQTTQGTQGEKGTGLGLLLCKEMVEKNSGKIWVESTEGKGSTFYFTLPSDHANHL